MAGLWLAVMTALLLSAAPAGARIFQADDQLTCQGSGGEVNVDAFLQAHHATVLRIVVPYSGPSNTLTCARAAAAEGYRVYLSFPYPNAWRPAQVAAHFRRTLPPYARYAWAVSVGNEQDLAQGGALAPHGRSVVCTGAGRHRTCRRSTAGEDYRAVWDAVEPVLARTAPRAIRAYGETSPFSFPFLKDSFVTGRPRGAQAVAFHCYDTKNGGLRIVPQVAAWAASKHLPLWCSEMSAALVPNVHSWLQVDSQSRWNALLASVEAHSPNLKMVSYYRWPQIGAL